MADKDLWHKLLSAVNRDAWQGVEIRFWLIGRDLYRDAHVMAEAAAKDERVREQYTKIEAVDFGLDRVMGIRIGPACVILKGMKATMQLRDVLPEVRLAVHKNADVVIILQQCTFVILTLSAFPIPRLFDGFSSVVFH